MAKNVLTSLDMQNASRILNLPNAVGAQEPATKAQLDAIATGLNWKQACRVATTANVSIASAPAAIDGVTLSNGDRVLVKNQTSALENGIRVFTSAGAALARATDADAYSELVSAIVPVTSGTANAGSTWRQTQTGGTLDVSNIVFDAFSAAAPTASEAQAGIIEIADQAETDAGSLNNRAVTPQGLANHAGRVRRISQNIGDGAASQIDVTHNFNTLDVHVTLVEIATGKDVMVEVTRISVNAVRFNFTTVPTVNQYRASVVA